MRKLIFVSLWLSLAQAFLLVPVSFSVKQIFDTAIPEKNLELISVFAVSVFFLMALNAAMAIFETKVTLRISIGIVHGIREEKMKIATYEI